MDKTMQSELSQFVLWFGENTQIPADVRRMVVGEYLSTAELSPETAELVDRWLAFLEYESKQKMDELAADYQTFNVLAEAEENPETSFAGSVLHQAETEMMRVALKFKNEFEQMKKQRLAAAESDEHLEELAEVQALKNKL
ncbi:hypothetical protein CSB37_02500 [bacterium DOLZORAL124_38_8]|nr:MAG: hypothetical protein CSB37_02500 [bacterium DOLZORAL124_38_8]